MIDFMKIVRVTEAAIRARWHTLVSQILPVSWRFRRIYRTRHWGGQHVESASGKGSAVEATGNVRNELPALLRRLGCKTLLDLGCGDFNWMQHVNLDAQYIGADIVPDVIQENQARYARPGIEFRVIDGISDALPRDVDVVLCREVLFHLSFRHALAVIRNIKSSNLVYLLTTQISSEKENVDTFTAGFRPLDLEKPPFNFPAPLHCISDDGVSANRAICVWRIADLPEV